MLRDSREPHEGEEDAHDGYRRNRRQLKEWEVGVDSSLSCLWSGTRKGQRVKLAVAAQKQRKLIEKEPRMCLESDRLAHHRGFG